MSSHQVSCWSCGHTWSFSPPLGRGELCTGCRRDAKVCRNCRFYDRNSNGECAESQADLVKDKEKSNFCEWFQSRTESGLNRHDIAANPLDQLFGASSEPKAKSKIEEELEAFFRKK